MQPGRNVRNRPESQCRIAASLSGLLTSCKRLVQERGQALGQGFSGNHYIQRRIIYIMSTFMIGK